MSTLSLLKAQTDAGSAERKRLAERKKYSASKLNIESNQLISKNEIADNIDLDLILSEYEEYYNLKFNRKPKFVRKLKDDEVNSRITNENSVNTSKRIVKNQSSGNSQVDKLPSVTQTNNSQHSQGPEVNDELGIQGTSVNSKSKKLTDIQEDRTLKPPPQFGGDLEMKQLASSISREIYQESPNIRFDDIVSLHEAKRLLSEAVQLPLKFPTIFTGILRPWRGILLHGPPGTGKTMLAKAVATECNTTFFNISASTLVSKWRGDSEKLVRVLFELARYHAPSTIFLDEIDSILTSRGGEGNEHEASRRMKTELLIQMDGVKGNLNSSKPIDQVFVMAASNLPWDLDIAVLRRLEKRVLVGLPVSEARESMIRRHLQDRSSEDFDFEGIANKTDGFSGADIELLCREAAMMPVRRLMLKINQLDSRDSEKQNSHQSRSKQTILVPSSLNVDELIKSDPVSMDDIRAALSTTRPSSDGNMSKYESWQHEFGSS